MSRVGTISGSIHFEGPVPEQSVLQLGGWSECAAQHEGTVYASNVLVTNGKLQNALVYIKNGLGDRVFTVPEQPVQNDQKGCVFLPRVMAVQVDQPIRFLNSDQHEQAFDEHFQMGFLALRPHFDHPQYVEDVFAIMAQQARGDGADSVAEAMELIGENIDVDSPLLFSHPEDA